MPVTIDQQQKVAQTRQRITRIDSWLHGPADRHGECDECHANVVALWEDMDATEDGDGGQWEYCRRCWGHRLAALRDRLSRMFR